MTYPSVHRAEVAVLSFAATLLIAIAPTPAQRADEAIVAKLIDALNDNDLDVRQHLAIALNKIGNTAVEPLIDALKDASADRRAGAAYALALFGSAGKTALPTLLDLLKDTDVNVRRQASYAVSRILPANGGGR